MKTFEQFILENYEEQVSKVVKNPNPKKNYSNTKYKPLSPSEQKKALETLSRLPKAGKDRNWFNTDNEIDTRDLGFIHSKSITGRLVIGSGKSIGPGLIPRDKIVAMQSSIKVEGLEAYIANERLTMPVVLEYKNQNYFSVLTGHTRIAVQMLAGRPYIEALVVLEDWLFGKSDRRLRPNYTE